MNRVVAGIFIFGAVVGALGCIATIIANLMRLGVIGK